MCAGIACLLAAAAVLLAQTESGALSGRLADLHFNPQDGVILTLLNVTTHVQARTTADSKGEFHFGGLAPGQYTLLVESPQQGRRSLPGIVVAAGYESRVHTALQFEGAPVKLVLRPLRENAIAHAERTDAFPSSPVEVPHAPSPSTHLLFSRSRGDAPEPTTTAASLEIALVPEPVLALELASRSRAPAPWLALPVASRLRPESAERALVGTLANILVTNAASRLSHPELQPGSALLSSDTLPLPALSQQTLDPAPASGEPEFPVLKTLLMSGRGSVMAIAASSAADLALRLPWPQSDSSFAAAPHIDPVSDTALTGEQLQALPLNGRNWAALARDLPADLAENDDANASNAKASGGSNVSVDGLSTRLAFGESRSARSSSSAAESAIREVQISNSDGDPEQTRVETRSGTQSLHGQTFLLNRQNLWGARNPFTQWVKETSPASTATGPTFTAFPYTPPDRQTAWGLGVGGSMRPARLFWFAALDREQRNDPAVASVKHPENFFAQPTNDEMLVLSARLGLSGANSAAEGLAAYSTMLESVAGLLGPAPRTSSQWTSFARLDWNAAERHRGSLEATANLSDSPGGGLTRASEPYGSHSFGSSHADTWWLLGRWQAFLTPNLLAVTQASIGRQIMQRRPETPSSFEQTLNASAWGQVPQMVVDSRYGFTIGNPSRFGSGSRPDEHTYEVQETLNWVHGTLLMKAGTDLRHNVDAVSMVPNHTGTYFYANLEDFISDALVFTNYGLSNALSPAAPHNCDQTGKAWRDSSGQLHGLGYLPCYSYYSQTMGPTNWQLSTNNWAGYATAQWQPAKRWVLSASLRWEQQQLPPPLASLRNPDLPLTQTLPSLGGEWAPRAALAWGMRESHWPVLQAAYGMYFGRTEDSVLQTALIQTGSLHGDAHFFMRPTDNLVGEAGGAPPFPYVLAGEPASVVKPAAVEFAPGFRNPEVQQGVIALEETLPGHLLLSASAVASLGRRLPITVDTNFDPTVNPETITYGVVDASGKGPIKTQQLKVPFYATWPTATGMGGRLYPGYQQIAAIMSRANSTYEAAIVRITRQAKHGLTLRGRYTYAHAMDWNPNESGQVSGSSVLDPANFSAEYGTGNLDVRHSASLMFIWESPWKLKDKERWLANNWMISAVGQFHSGLPYTMQTAGSIPKEFDSRGSPIVGLGPGINGYGGDNRLYSVGRNTYRYPPTWKADLRLGRRFSLPHEREMELLAESFNLFNHQNVTRLETTGYYIEPGSLAGALPTLNLLSGLKSGQTEFGRPLDVNATDTYRPRQIDLGLRLRF